MLIFYVQGRSKLDNWGGGGTDIHIFVFCTINFFEIDCFYGMKSIIELATALMSVSVSYNTYIATRIWNNQISK